MISNDSSDQAISSLSTGQAVWLLSNNSPILQSSMIEMEKASLLKISQRQKEAIPETSVFLIFEGMLILVKREKACSAFFQGSVLKLNGSQLSLFGLTVCNIGNSYFITKMGKTA